MQCSRSQFGISLLWFVLGVVPGLIRAEDSVEHPNVLLVLCDDIRYNALR